MGKRSHRPRTRPLPTPSKGIPPGEEVASTQGPPTGPWDGRRSTTLRTSRGGAGVPWTGDGQPARYPPRPPSTNRYFLRAVNLWSGFPEAIEPSGSASCRRATEAARASGGLARGIGKPPAGSGSGVQLRDARPSGPYRSLQRRGAEAARDRAAEAVFATAVPKGSGCPGTRGESAFAGRYRDPGSGLRTLRPPARPGTPRVSRCGGRASC